MTFVSSTNPPISAVLDYTSRDYASIYSDLVARIPSYIPAWTNMSSNNFGIALIELFAYVGDLIHYYVDRLAGEAFIQTATQAVSILNLASMLDYLPTLSVGATAELQINISGSLDPSYYPYLIPAGTTFATQGSSTTPAITFQTVESLVIQGPSGATPSLIGFVDVQQGVTQLNEAVGTSDGTVNQILPLQYNPVSANSFVVSVDIGLGPQPWSYVQNLVNSGPTDQVYTNFVDANGIFYVIFGDGVNGAVPPLGSPIFCTYQTNVGGVGNVGAGTIVVPTSGLVGVVSCTNSSAADGGSDAESLVSIQTNAPASLKALNRAVTADDFQTLTIQVPGVQWASAQIATYQLVNLFIAPFGGGQPTSVLVQAVQNYLTGDPPLVLAGSTVTIQGPTYVPIVMTMTVNAFSNYSNEVVKQNVVSALEELFDLDNTGFAYRISLGVVYQVVLAQAGVNYVNISSLYRSFDAYVTGFFETILSYTTIAVTPLPEPFAVTDSVFIVYPDGRLQQVTLNAPAPAGAQILSVNSFTPIENVNAGIAQIRNTGLNQQKDGDCVLLFDEIPVTDGEITVNVTGGIPGT